MSIVPNQKIKTRLDTNIAKVAVPKQHEYYKTKRDKQRNVAYGHARCSGPYEWTSPQTLKK